MCLCTHINLGEVPWWQALVLQPDPLDSRCILSCLWFMLHGSFVARLSLSFLTISLPGYQTTISLYHIRLSHAFGLSDSCLTVSRLTLCRFWPSHYLMTISPSHYLMTISLSHYLTMRLPDHCIEYHFWLSHYPFSLSDYQTTTSISHIHHTCRLTC